MKRGSSYDDTNAKRRNANVAERLVDLPDAFAAFSDSLAAERALSKGLLKNWSATEKYHELESKLLTYHRDAEDESWLEKQSWARLKLAKFPEGAGWLHATLIGYTLTRRCLLISG